MQYEIQNNKIQYINLYKNLNTMRYKMALHNTISYETIQNMMNMYYTYIENPNLTELNYTTNTISYSL